MYIRKYISVYEKIYRSIYENIFPHMRKFRHLLGAIKTREFDIKEWHNTLVISVFYFPHSVFQTLILLSDGFLSTSEAQ